MAKFKEGDVVKFTEDVSQYNITKDEVGIVTDFDKDYQQVSLRVLNDEGGFDATMVVDVTQVKKIGSQIKLVKIKNLREDDILLLDGDSSSLPFKMDITVAHKITGSSYDEETGELTLSGKNFEIVVPESDFNNKIPVVR